MRTLLSVIEAFPGMAPRHDAERGSYRSPITRRTTLKAAGAGLLAGLTGAVGTAAAQSGSIDLGKEGLSNGDDIDPYLERHFASGNDVYVPPGDYQSKFTWWGTEVADATLRGDPQGVRLHRPKGLRHEEDDGSDYKIEEKLSFDGHVVVENITMKGKHGWQQNRFDQEGQSGDAHLELRNFNIPDGTVGNSDSLFGRSYGQGRVDFKWCYVANYPNSMFYQLDSGADVRQVFDGCVFRNATNVHRNGCREYTVRNCIYIADGDAPQFCEEENAPCDSDPMSGSQRPFKFDGGFGWSGGTIENVHFYATDAADLIAFMDFQGEQTGISGSMDGVYVYNGTDTELFSFGWEVGDAWDISNVHVTGPGNTSTPEAVSTVSNPKEPITDHAIRTPKGKRIATLDGGGAGSPAGSTSTNASGSTSETTTTSGNATADAGNATDGSSG